MKVKRPTFTELVQENKEILLKDKKALEEIEKRIELKALKILENKQHQ